MPFLGEQARQFGASDGSLSRRLALNLLGEYPYDLARIVVIHAEDRPRRMPEIAVRWPRTNVKTTHCQCSVSANSASARLPPRSISLT